MCCKTAHSPTAALTGNSFESGDYVLAAGAYHEGVSTPAEGETVALAGTDFTVLGSVMHDNAYLSGSNSTEATFSIAYLLPLEAFDRLFPDQAYRQLAVNIDHSQQESFEEYLTEHEQGLNYGIGITRRSEYQQNFEASRLNAVLPEVIIGLVLLGIALINFVNMLVVKTVSRKGEFAVYESLGMTRAQLRQLMLAGGRTARGGDGAGADSADAAVRPAGDARGGGGHLLLVHGLHLFRSAALGGAAGCSCAGRACAAAVPALCHPRHHPGAVAQGGINF